MKSLRFNVFTMTAMVIGATACLVPSGLAAPKAEKAGIAPTRALELLMRGNKRFTEDKTLNNDRDVIRRTTVAKGQQPFAVIVGCSDSRVPAEVIFDQGLGSLFVVRTAGHVVGNAAIGSVEYAVEVLGAQLVVVLGHERCGAVDAAAKGGTAPGKIGTLIEAIQPAVKSVKRQRGALVDNSISANVKMVVSQMRMLNPILSTKSNKATLRIVGARYDLDTGVVSIVPVSNADVNYWKRTVGKTPLATQNASMNR